MIETHLIETFVAVVRQGSVTEAARALQKSQPAVSHRLRQLEEAFGIPLFERAGRGLVLTDAGGRLLSEAEELLERLDGLPDRVAGAASTRGTVTVGTFPTLGRYRLLPALGRVLSEQPDVKLVFRYDDTDTLRAALLEGEVDIIVVTGELDQRGLEVETIGQARAAVAVAAGEPMTATVAELRERRYLGWKDAIDPTFAAIDAWAGARQFARYATPEIPDIESLRALAADGVGWICLPDYVLADDERLTTFRAPGLPKKFLIRLAVREGLPEGTAAHAVRRVFRAS